MAYLPDSNIKFKKFVPDEIPYILMQKFYLKNFLYFGTESDLTFY